MQYSGLKIISVFLRIIGGIICICGFGVAVIVIFGSPIGVHGPNDGYLRFMQIMVAIGVGILGLMILASGQLIQAIVDIAQNTKAAAQHAAKTVQFFEHVVSPPNFPNVPRADRRPGSSS
jgi:hypothetical protein